MNKIFTFILSICFMFAAFSAIADNYVSSKTISLGGGTLTIDLSINTNTNLVTMDMTGPSNVYFAFGFGGSGIMTNTYAIILDGNGLTQERSLGNHSQGTLLGQSITVNQNTVSGSTRTVSLTRAITGINGNYFTFPTSASTFNLLAAIGGAASFGGYHSGGRTSTTLTTVLAQEFTSSTSVNLNGNTVTLDLNINTGTNLVTFDMTGPSSIYYAFGFGSNAMSGTYALIIEGTGGIEERKLGNHNQGNVLTSTINVIENKVTGSTRTVQFTRAIDGMNSDYFTFPTTGSSFNFIAAVGGGQTISYHSARTAGLITTTLLPIQLVDFSSKNIDRDIALNWSTASEINNDKFIIQRRSEDKDWSTLNEIDGGGDSQTLLNYTYLDVTPPVGVNYYRLLQVDFDGTISKSKTISATISPTKFLENLSIKPTIATNEIILTSLKKIYNTTNISIFNQDSKEMVKSQWKLGTSSQTININHLIPGLYFIRIKNADEYKTYRFFKE